MKSQWFFDGVGRKACRCNSGHVVDDGIMSVRGRR